jgi:hypothetical protein
MRWSKHVVKMESRSWMTRRIKGRIMDIAYWWEN